MDENKEYIFYTTLFIYLFLKTTLSLIAFSCSRVSQHALHSDIYSGIQRSLPLPTTFGPFDLLSAVCDGTAWKGTQAPVQGKVSYTVHDFRAA